MSKKNRFKKPKYLDFNYTCDICEFQSNRIEDISCHWSEKHECKACNNVYDKLKGHECIPKLVGSGDEQISEIFYIRKSSHNHILIDYAYDASSSDFITLSDFFEFITPHTSDLLKIKLKEMKG